MREGVLRSGEDDNEEEEEEEEDEEEEDVDLLTEVSSFPINSALVFSFETDAAAALLFSSSQHEGTSFGSHSQTEQSRRAHVPSSGQKGHSRYKSTLKYRKNVCFVNL